MKFLPSIVAFAPLFCAASASAQPSEPPSELPSAPASTPPSAPPSVPADAPPSVPAITTPGSPAAPEAYVGLPRAADYVGLAAPATPAGTVRVGEHVRVGLEIFAQYDYRNTASSGGTHTWFHDFDLSRAHGAIEGELGDVRARLLLEAVQSASEGALVGVGGNSLIMRLREAYAAYRAFGWLDARAGIVPTATLGELDGTWMLRAVSQSPLESSALASPADAGVNVKATFPSHFGWASVGAYNGEGYTSPDLNRGKNLELAAEFHPIAGAARAALPFAVFASYVVGSAGTNLARADRLTAAILWQGVRVRAGVDLTYGWGAGSDGTVNSVISDAFVRVEPVNRLLLGARASTWVRNVDAASADRLTTLTGSVGWRLANPLETHLAITRSSPTSAARDALLGSDNWDARVIARVVF